MRNWMREFTGERILQILLDKSGASWALLCNELGVPPHADHHPDEMALINILWALYKADLIEYDDLPGESKTRRDKRDFYRLLTDAASGGPNAQRRIRASMQYVTTKEVLASRGRRGGLGRIAVRSRSAPYLWKASRSSKADRRLCSHAI
jgi:hypothetical protein